MSHDRFNSRSKVLIWALACIGWLSVTYSHLIKAVGHMRSEIDEGL